MIGWTGVKKAGCADLMSDVLVFCKAGNLLLTGLTNPQVIDGHILDIAAIVMVRENDLFRNDPACRELQIPILTNKYILFEVSAGYMPKES